MPPLLSFLLFERLNQHAIAERFYFDFHICVGPSRRKNAISMLSTNSNTFADLRCSGSRYFDRRGFNARLP